MGVFVGVSVDVAVGASMDVSVGDRCFAVGTSVEITVDVSVHLAVEIAMEIPMVSAMGLHDARLLAAAFRGIPCNFHGSPWTVRDGRWIVHGCPWNTVGMAVECRGGRGTVPRCSYE